jgi:isoleucyl-tRNA synthetase
MSLSVKDLEQKILNFWDKNKIFQKSLRQRRKKPYFSFYDGPPFATGKPHYGHLLATTIKDTVLRYWTMRGYQVPRRVGWDCHGLPVENLIEKELGIKNKKEIEQFGIEKFNKACRQTVFRHVEDFEKILKRFGRWADYKNSYATLDSNYIESVWWVLKQLWNQGLVYKDYRVSPYCPRCGTPLSNFEVNQGYKETKDPSIFVKFKLKEPDDKKEEKKVWLENTFFLVWTTTPWTLPGNVGLAVHPKADYILVSQGKENYILAESRKDILEGEYNIIKKFSGKDIIGLKYEPIFDSLLSQKPRNIENAFQVLPADFVSLEEGTGIVHIAVMYGEDDFQLGKKFNLPTYHTVDDSGCFKEIVKEFAGKFVKEVDPEIINNLSRKGLLYKKEEIMHSYPFCWRCDTPLLYYAIDSWFIAVTKFKKELIRNNKKIRWVPAYIKIGRFGNWLKEARDWNFSRNRFWGAPLPIWQCQGGDKQKKRDKIKECNNVKVVGSLAELRKLSGKKPKDLHRPYIDEITFSCEKCQGIMKRVPEVFDCWFESGSMPYAQWHYPFENKKLVEKTFPADFIAEGLDQTRGWFYTLHVLATALTLKNIGLGREKPAFKNVIVNGLILDAQGRKLSKKLGNYPEPQEILDLYGADSLRYFLLASTPIGQDYRFSAEAVKEVWRKIFSTFLNSYLFFKTYREKKFIPQKGFKIKRLLNKWIISRLQGLNKEINYWMERYEITKAARSLADFLDDFSNWYIRRSRRSFQKPKFFQEKEEASQTFYWTLKNFTCLAAPFLPFLSEYVYQELRIKGDKESVHLVDFPKVNQKLIDRKLEKQMTETRRIVALALGQRAYFKIKVRQPLQKLKIKKLAFKAKKELLELIKEEVNVKEIIFDPKIKKEIELDTKITPLLKEEGMVRELIRQIQEMRKKASLKPKDKILLQYSSQVKLKKVVEKYKNYILEEISAKDLEFKEEISSSEGKYLNFEGQEFWFILKKL